MKDKMSSVRRMSLIALLGATALVSGQAIAAKEKDAKAEKAKTEAVAEAPPAGEGAAGAPAGEEPMIRLGNPTVAVVDGVEIKRADVFNFIGALPEQVRQMPIQNLFPLALEQVINNKVITKKAESAKLEADPEVTKLFEQAKEQIVRNVYVERQVGEQINNKKLLKAYDELLTKSQDIQETRARHILVDSEEKAREIIKKLDGGAKFEDLSKEYSSGPSAENGGDLGYFAKDEMVPEFADAAFALEKGKYTKDPVKTQFGWHVVKVEDRRKRPEPQFEEVKPQLEAQLRQQTLTEMLEKWQKDSKIKKFDINGDPIKP